MMTTMTWQIFVVFGEEKSRRFRIGCWHHTPPLAGWGCRSTDLIFLDDWRIFNRQQ